MHRCRECQVTLQEGRNWHKSYAARTYRHCMDCARAYSRRRYGRIKPTVKRRVATATAPRLIGKKREQTARKRVEAARLRRERSET